VRSVPQVFTVHAFKDDSYAIGMTPTLWICCIRCSLPLSPRTKCGMFEIFATCAANLVGVYYVRTMPEEVEEGVSLLFDVYRKWPAGFTQMVDGFRDAPFSSLCPTSLVTFTSGTSRKEGSAGSRFLTVRSSSLRFPITLASSRQTVGPTWILRPLAKTYVADTRSCCCRSCASHAVVRLSLSESGPGLVKVFDDAHPSDAERADDCEVFAGRQLHVPPNPCAGPPVKLDNSWT